MALHPGDHHHGFLRKLKVLSITTLVLHFHRKDLLHVIPFLYRIRADIRLFR
jgi:hypothetical protein